MASFLIGDAVQTLFPVRWRLQGVVLAPLLQAFQGRRSGTISHRWEALFWALLQASQRQRYNVFLWKRCCSDDGTPCDATLGVVNNWRRWRRFSVVRRSQKIVLGPLPASFEDRSGAVLAQLMTSLPGTLGSFGATVNKLYIYMGLCI